MYRRHLVDISYGVLLSTFVLVGRWSFGRLGETAARSVLLLQPRMWLVIAVLIQLALITIGRKARVLSIDKGTKRISLLVQLFLGYMLVSTLWSAGLDTEHRYLVFGKAYEIGLMLFVIILIRWSLRVIYPKEMFEGIWIGVLIWGFLLSVAGIVGYGGEDRLAALGGGPNVFGRNMALLCIGSMFAARGKDRYKVWLFVWFLGASSVILSGSRGALLSATAAISVTFVLMGLSIQRKSVMVICALIVSLAVLHLSPLGSRMIAVFEARAMKLTLEEKYTSGRSELFDRALEIGKENIFVGVGLGGFARFTGAKYPHNIFLEAFSEGGIVGLLLLTGTFGYIVWIFWRQRSNLDAYRTGAFILFLLSSQFSGNLFDSRGAFIFGILASMPPSRASIHLSKGQGGSRAK